MKSHEVLQNIIVRAREVRNAGERPVAVFDLDATLFDNGPRTWQILTEFAQEVSSEVLETALQNYRQEGLPYLLSDMFSEMGIDDEKLAKAATAFWFKRFFTDAYQSYDRPMTGSVEFVRELFQLGTTIVYLSGRDSPGMLVGCSESLRQHGYPVGLPFTSIVLKPDFETADEVFKEQACEFIGELGTVIATIDNEPGNVNLFQRIFAESINVLIHTNAAPGAPEPLDGLAHIENFSSWVS